MCYVTRKQLLDELCQADADLRADETCENMDRYKVALQAWEEATDGAELAVVRCPRGWDCV